MKSSNIQRIGILPALILILMLILQPSGIVLSSLGAAVLHELGHMLAAAILGVPLRSLDVGMFGASLRVRGSLISYPKEFLLCAAGPAMNFLSAFAVIALSERRGYFTDIGEWFASVSLMLGVLNLIPAEGFDGGRMLSVTVTSLFGPRVSAKLLSLSTFLSILLLWMFSVYLLIRFGTSLSLFVFTLSLFYRLFIEKA
ncbi:MAG: site-2 protease family protein [Clostridia bacterium]|nr:site-2 protease family protein [Clostridia bacterium]